MSQQDEAAFFVRSFGCALFNKGDIMKIGLRTPSLKKSFKARTTGKLKRKIKKATNPFYGKKGMGYIKNPKRAIKSALYHRTTFGISDIFRWLSK